MGEAKIVAMAWATELHLVTTTEPSRMTFQYARRRG